MAIFEKGLAESGEVISNPISLPVGNKWSVLKLDKVEDDGSFIDLSILDEFFNPISSISFNGRNDQIDISALNEINIEKIRLKAHFTPSDNRSPILKGWGVEWNKTSIWSDQFLTSLKISEMKDTQVYGRSVNLKYPHSVGYVDSIPISVPSGSIWNKAYFEANYTYPSKVSFEILNPYTKLPIGDYKDITKSIINLDGIDPIEYPEIILRAKLDFDSSI